MNQTAFNDAELDDQRELDNGSPPPKPPATLNPFGANLPATQASNAAVAVEQSRAIAEVQAAMTIAQKFPRDQIASMDRILMAFTRPSLAETALYEYSRGGSEVTGLSIRAAEAMAQQWGHIQMGVRELEQRQGESTVEAYAFDAQTGTRDSRVFQVKHWRDTKRGGYKIEDQRDIYELVANLAARRKRACILAVIPGDVQEAVKRQVEITLKAKIEITPELIKSLEDKFGAFGVPVAAIEKRIQRRLDAITPALVLTLGKIYNSLRDGMSSAVDWFELEAQSADTAASEQVTRGAAGLKAAAAKTAKAAPKGAADPPPVNQTAEAMRDNPPPSPGNDVPADRPTLPYATVRDQLDKAKDREALDQAAASIDLVVSLPQQKELTDYYKARRAELSL